MNTSVTFARPGAVKGVSAPGRSRFLAECGLYMSSLIIGAGILGLPTLTATIGLIPGIGLTLLLGVGLAFVYARIAAAVHAATRTCIADAYTASSPLLERAGVGQHMLPELTRRLGPWLVERKGIGILDIMCSWLGFGRAGRSALTFGLAAFVLPAMVLYLVGGGIALGAIADRLRSASTSPVLPGLLASGGLLAGAITPRLLPRLPGMATLTALLQMAASWLAAITILMLVPEWRPLPILLFTAIIVALIMRTTPPRGRQQLPREPFTRRHIEPAHRIGIVLVSINLALIAITSGLALLVLRQHGLLARPAMIAPELDTGAVAKAVGGLLFAFTGTGVFNLIRYPALFEPEGRSGRPSLGTVVMIGTIIPTLAYLGWMVAVAFALPPQVLIHADNERSYATVPLAALLAEHGSLGWIVFVSGYTVALLAVTSAGIGGAESLADRLARMRIGCRPFEGTPAGRDREAAPDPTHVRHVQIGIIVFTSGLALLLQSQGDGFALRHILAVAGYAGGGLLMLVLPFLLPTDGQRRIPGRRRSLVAAIAVCLATLNVLKLPEGIGQSASATVAGGIVVGITLLFLGTVLWLLLGEPSGHA